ncbi:hypothetical protein LINGRAHAP2_LOCUS4206, partial [Linum grandiflorum]
FFLFKEKGTCKVASSFSQGQIVYITKEFTNCFSSISLFSTLLIKVFSFPFLVGEVAKPGFWYSH